MPNYCENQLHFDCSKEDFEQKIRPLLKGKDSDGKDQDLTFNIVVPMPDHIFRGPVGEKERKLYGADNWYDWRVANWGTKWDAWDSRVDWECIQFTTAWSPPDYWYEALALRLAELGITAHADFYVEGGFPGSLGGYDIKDGKVSRTEADEDFAKIYAYEEDEDEDEE